MSGVSQVWINQFLKFLKSIFFEWLFIFLTIDEIPYLVQFAASSLVYFLKEHEILGIYNKFQKDQLIAVKGKSIIKVLWYKKLTELHRRVKSR